MPAMTTIQCVSKKEDWNKRECIVLHIAIKSLDFDGNRSPPANGCQWLKHD